MAILILDSNKLFAAGMKYFLESLLSGAKADYATSYAEATDRLRTGRFALLIMEIGIARDNGLRVLKRLRSEFPSLPLLVLSIYPTDYYGPKVIRAGACGFIDKSSEPEQLLSAVQCVLKGKHYISPELADRLALGLGAGPNGDAPHERLSAREMQVFRRLALGESVTCIARSLELSVKTVDTHRTKILRKMGMNDRQQLARYAFERGLIPSRRLGEGRNRASAALSEQATH
jgi:DNA-binding NarL/FixJ family response regulator